MKKGIIRLRFCIWLLFAGISMSAQAQEPIPGGIKEAVNIGSHLELFIDDYIIQSLSGEAELRLHHPVPAELAIVHDRPWEGSGSSFHSVFKDGNIYRMYYSAWDFTIKPGKVTDNSHPFLLCYAESVDGVHWRKPNLGLFAFHGSKANNIVLTSDRMGAVHPDPGHPAVFKDERPGVPADERYKAIIREYTAQGSVPPGVLAMKSGDGIHWAPMVDKPVITDGAFDSQNLAFWDAGRGEYRAYWRWMKGGTLRSIRTARSDDFIHWTDQHDLVYENSPVEHLYTNVVKTYFREPQLLIGFPIRYTERGWSPVMEELPDSANRRLRASAVERFGTALTESLLMVSRDGVHFKRWNEAFLRPGIERTGTWNYGQQYIAWSMVPTRSALPGAPDEISLYAVEGTWGTIAPHKDALRRYTLRADGFVSVNAPMSGGELVTRPVVFTGRKLVLNYSSAAAGDIRVELQDQEGKPIPGYTLDDCVSLFGDTIARGVSWKNGNDLSSLAGRPVRIRFVLRDADLFSFCFK